MSAVPLETGTAIHAIKRRIMLVEDHGILREGLRALLELETDLTVCAEAGTVNEALARIESADPELIITDIALPGRSGIEFIAELERTRPDIRVLVLTAHASEEYVRASLNAGAHAYVLKDASRADLLHGIRAVLAGQRYLYASVASKVIAGYLQEPGMGGAAKSSNLVTERERQVMVRIALGLSNKLIARELSVSVKTVEKHRANLMRKLTLRNTAAITLFAIRNGLISGEQQTAGAVP